MLKELSIRDFKLLGDAALRFSAGLNVLTGETGAGKTQCLEALKAALGTRIGEDAISKEANKSIATAVFDLSNRPDILESLVTEGWCEEEETEVILERTIERNGPSLARLNGRRVPIGALQSIGEKIVDLLGQHARADILTRPSLEILDSLGDANHRERVREVRELYSSWSNTKKIYDDERKAIEHARERHDLAEFQHRELEKAELSEGEEDRLTKEAELLSNTKERIELANELSALLHNEDENSPSARDLLQKASDILERISSVDDSLVNELLRMKEMVYLAEEVSDKLKRYADEIADDPDRRAIVEERLLTIHNLKRKYRTDELGLIGLRNKLAHELETVAGADEHLGKLAASRDSARAEYLKKSQALSKLRKKLASRIGREVLTHLADLDLPHATFDFVLSQNPDPENDDSALRPDGIDSAEILIATNPAQTPAPLKKVASGGELSRILLALKTVLAERDRVPVLVFDEAEAGIGGETAFKIGEKLLELSRSHQLIIVSHLPQIAGMADCHWVIEKSTDGVSTKSTTRSVVKDERVAEIERMLGSRGDKKALNKLARSMLSSGGSGKM
ncbi:MAG: DNA repair protein RecN [bacterium]